MGHPRKISGKDKSGQECKVQKKPQIINPYVRVAEVKEEDIASEIDSFTGFENFFIPDSSKDSPDKDRYIALKAINQPEPNYREIYHVTFLPKQDSKSNQKHTPVIKVFSVVPDTNKCPHKLEVSLIGTPKTALADDSAVKTITDRLSTYDIKKSDEHLKWKDNDWKVILTGLNALTNDELKRIEGVKIARKSSGKKPDIGGTYSQDKHTIYIYDKGLSNGTIMALGNNPNSLLPAGVHAILHEAGHAMAYFEVRNTYADYKKAETLYNDAKADFKNKWPVQYQEQPDGSWQADGASVAKDDQVKFNQDLQKLKRHAANIKGPIDKFKAKQKEFDNIAGFKKAAEKLTPVTKYSLKERDVAQDMPPGEDKKRKERAALDEFFAEAFALYHWAPEWLKWHRKIIYDYFKAENHKIDGKL